ncbi:MAG: flagellar basal body P-ring protein FlgI, partial [Armatimonadetes bacterium]|nr:flagellar basal body P-ring protein FlgI [Armatimonadota bacterium]
MVMAGAWGWAAASGAVRIKDIVRTEGARDNQLVGYGLVVGLDGTGDSAQVGFTGQAVQNLVRHFGNSAEAGAKVKT